MILGTCLLVFEYLQKSLLFFFFSGDDSRGERRCHAFQGKLRTLQHGACGAVAATVMHLDVYLWLVHRHCSGRQTSAARTGLERPSIVLGRHTCGTTRGQWLTTVTSWFVRVIARAVTKIEEATLPHKQLQKDTLRTA